MTNLFSATLLASAMMLVNATEVVAGDRVQAGQWETKLTSGSGKPMVTKYCITAKEAKAMSGNEATVRKYVKESTSAATKGRCAVKNVELKGNRTTVTIACGKTEVVGTTTYSGDRYETLNSNGSRVVGKRLGACP